MFARRSIRRLLLGLLLSSIPALSLADVFVSVRVAPPPLPVYVQPVCPGDGYLWTPGYWAYGPAGYYWVPGVWVRPPRIGVLWTPGYWGWGGGIYSFHAGYWAPHVGFYGGVNYGFGYGGVGFQGGYWNGNRFAYNTAVTRVNTTVIHNTYNRTVINNTVVNNRTSFNGGPGGIRYRAAAQEQLASSEQHFQPTPNQIAHREEAGANRSQWASVNHGKPVTAATRSVNEQRENQQERIGQGVADGQLTPREAARSENREARINHEVRADRQANGGRLTQGERNRVERQQNRENRQIRNEKHNEREAPR